MSSNWEIKVEELPPWAQLDEAKNEEKGWSDLDKVRKANDVRWLKCFGWIVVIMTVVFSTLFLVALLIWSYHYMAPDDWKWLSHEDLSKIQSVLFSGGMGAIVSGIIRGQLSKAK